MSGSTSEDRDPAGAAGDRAGDGAHGGASGGASREAVDRPPNIVLLMTDQQRVGLTAASGGADTMPTLDRLMADGSRFEHAYTSSPICVPARTSMLTGRFPSAHRVRQNSTPRHAYFEGDLLDTLRERGYSLHFSGKPHMHPGPEDFDSYHGPFFHDSSPRGSAEQREFDAWLQELDHAVAAEPTPFPVGCQYPSRIVDGAIKALDSLEVGAEGGSGGTAGGSDASPFFLWLSFPEPHNPYQAPEPYFSMFEDVVPPRAVGPEVLDTVDWRFRWLRELQESKRPGYDAQWPRYRANYLGMLRLIDDQIARLLEHLGDGAENTVFLFLADHGDFTGEYGLQRKGAAMPEILMRIPLTVVGPGVARQHRDELVSIVDVMPTLTDLAGAELPPGVQGRSLAPLLRGEAAPLEEFGSIYGELGYGGVSYREHDWPPLHFPYDGPTYDELNSVTMSGEMRMVVAGHHKLVVNDTGRQYLYDLEDDPYETRDLSGEAEKQEVLLALYRQLSRWMLRVADDLPVGAYTPRTRAHNWRWAPEE